MKVRIETLDHKGQRYDTVGDYMQTDAGLKILVSELNNSDYNFLVALHEFVEAYLCIKRGVDYAEIDTFDQNFKGEGEPGDDPKAPYHQSHLDATEIEVKMAQILGVDWGKYGDAIAALEYKTPEVKSDVQS